MYFTLMFVDDAEGPSRTYDLVFHPCPVWMSGKEIIGVPDNTSPHYNLGYLGYLMSLEDFGSIQFLSRNVTVSVHYNGQGKEEDLDALLEDLRNENYNPILWDPEMGEIYSAPSES